VQHDLKGFSILGVFKETHSKQHDTWHFMLFFISAMRQQNAVTNKEISFKNLLFWIIRIQLPEKSMPSVLEKKY